MLNPVLIYSLRFVSEIFDATGQCDRHFRVQSARPRTSDRTCHDYFLAAAPSTGRQIGLPRCLFPAL